MDANTINIKIRQGSESNLELNIEQAATVLKVKERLSQLLESKPSPSDMKLIFKGKILKDTDSLKDVGVANDNTLHLVVTNKSQPQTTSQPQQPTTNAQVPPMQAGLGGMGMGGFPFMGGLGGMGGMGGMGGFDPNNIDPNQMSQMLQNPQMQAMMQQMFSNPEMLQQVIASNPMLQNMVSSNPQFQQILQDPVMLQMLSNPQMIQSMLSGGGMGGPFGGLGGMGGMGGAPGVGTSAQQPTTGATGTNGTGQQPPNPFGNFNLMSLLSGGGIGGFGGAGLGAGLGANNNLPPEERFKTQLEQLNELGFTNKDVNIQALVATNGNVEAAVERILNMIGQ